jgi:hypothetical protein
VHFDGEERLVYSKDLIQEIFAGQTEVYWGLSGSSGQGGALQYACEVTPCEPGTPPEVSVGNVSLQEPAFGTAGASFPVTLSCAVEQVVRVDYATVDGEAVAGADYRPTSGTVFFQPGETSHQIVVPVVGDGVEEPTERFHVELGPAGGVLIPYSRGTATVADGPAGSQTPLLSVEDGSVPEGDAGTSDLPFEISLSVPSDREVRVDVTTVPDTAAEGEDYTPVSGTLTFPPGETRQTVAVPVHGDVLLEPDQTFFLDLSNPVNGEIADGRGVGTILDDEVCPGPELLVNGGGELRGSAGELPGWTVVEGSWRRRAASPAPFTGSRYLAAGAESPAELRQDVDVSAYADAIAAGGQLFRFSARLRTGAEDPSDVARIVVEYRDAADTVVLDVFDSGEIASPTEWREVFDERPAPAGTGRIRVRLLGTSFTGAGNDAYFDALSLVSLRAATLTVGDDAVHEGHAGTAPALFPVRLACPIDRPVTTSWATGDGTATAGEDYLPGSGPLSFPAGVTEATVSVEVKGDEVHELHETFRVTLGETAPGDVVVLDPVGTGTIANDDFCPRSPGFWKNHRRLWPVDWLEIGGVETDADGLLALLTDNGPDASHHLARQLVATELNLRVGSDPFILPVVALAHDFLAAHPPGSKPAGALKQQANALKDQLDAYNNLECEEGPVIPGT